MTLLLLLTLLFGGGPGSGNPDQDCGIRGDRCPLVLIEKFLRRHHH